MNLFLFKICFYQFTPETDYLSPCKHHSSPPPTSHQPGPLAQFQHGADISGYLSLGGKMAWAMALCIRSLISSHFISSWVWEHFSSISQLRDHSRNSRQSLVIEITIVLQHACIRSRQFSHCSSYFLGIKVFCFASQSQWIDMKIKIKWCGNWKVEIPLWISKKMSRFNLIREQQLFVHMQECYTNMQSKIWYFMVLQYRIWYSMVFRKVCKCKTLLFHVNLIKR